MTERDVLSAVIGEPGSGRVRYGAAMALYQRGQISAEQLEIFRVAAATDGLSPMSLMMDRGLPVPPQPPPVPEDVMRALLDEIDHYLSALRGPGISEVRQGIARRRQAQFQIEAPRANAVVDRHLRNALAEFAGSHPALSALIAEASPLMRWITYDGYDPLEIGEDFAASHAFATIIGDAGPIAGDDFDLGLFLIAPHVLYRDHRHPAPELYAPLTGPHGWRFGAGRPLQIKSAHEPVWNEPNRPHLTKVGAVPFLCVYCWTRDNGEPARVIPAGDWAELESLRL